MAFDAVPSSYYKVMKQYTLPTELLFEVGFPIELSAEGQVQISQENYFGDSSIEKQKCRCQATVSLRNENWYYARDCCYHPLKADKENSWNYRCCGKPFKSPGCVSSNFHTCSYIPIHGKWFDARKSFYLNSVSPFQVLALDCEFVFTEAGMEVARVSLVSLREGVVYDTFVKPENKILDYNTRFSGVTPWNLKQRNVKTLCQVQRHITEGILSCASILIGHGLHSDLKGLRICHNNIIDTSILYPHFKGFPYRYSLQYLAQEYLGITIHDKETGHDSVEDAKICLQLVALKCGLFGILELISRF